MISVVILTKNEEKNILECLKTLEFCDEIIIIDDNSTDKTIDLTLSLKNKEIKVIRHRLDGDFAKQRNFGLEQASGEWVLFIDADERVSDVLTFEISNSIEFGGQNLTSFNGFYIKRVDFMWGKELRHGETGHGGKRLRLAKKRAGKWSGKVHEKWNIDGKVGQLRNPLYHYPHNTIKEFLQEINFYTDIRARELFEERKSCSWISIILYPTGKFIVNYFFKKGILDGIPGLNFAVIMSFHSFLVRAKLWLLWERK